MAQPESAFGLQRVSGVLLDRTPIQDSIAHAVTSIAHIGARYSPDDDEYPPASAVVTDPVAVNAMLDEVCELYDMHDRQIGASFLVLAYFWNLAVGAFACYLLDRRVPDVASNAVSVDLRQGVVFRSPRCWALADDPAAGHPDLTVVRDLDCLRAQLVGPLVEQHAEPLFATLRAVAPYGIPAMRANFSDRLASVVLWLTEAMGNTELARSEVPACIALAYPRARTGIIEIEHQGRSGLFLQRGGCCLNYRLPGKEKCDTCSLRPRDERIHLLRQYVVENPATDC